MSEIEFAIGLEPKKAIEFLQHKYGIASKLEDKQLAESSRAKATRIANLSSLEMTKDIYQSLIEAQKSGQSFASWKKDIFAHFQKKGWVAGYDKKQGGYQLADPQTGEIFGSPRRLETIYRTNMQAAFSAQRYQQMRDNVDNRPYWQYSAVNDDRTRPSHGAMNGLIYRYDDPFWSVFYPPNGFNCRCSVIALAERDIQRRNLVVGNGEGRLVEMDRPNAKTPQGKTTAFKLDDQRYLMADKGFDYNVGRMTYKPNLDLYPEKLAHQFAKREMSGEGFEFDYRQFEKEIEPLLPKLREIKDKAERDQYLLNIRNNLRREYKFSAGVLSNEIKGLIKTELSTVWLSDDTLIKQLVNREGQEFGVKDYGQLPDILNQPELVQADSQNHFRFYKKIGENRYIAIVKILESVKEIYLQSYHLASEKQWKKAFK